MNFEVKVPCSSANLGPGFDSIGMALDRFLTLRFSPADHLSIEMKGVDAKKVRAEGENLLLRVMKKTFAKRNQKLPPFHLEVENEIPLTRGLGSSAAAIVGALMAANYLMGLPWTREELFQQATQWEGHPDNVGASLYGGVVIGSWDGKRADVITVDPPPLSVVVAIPEYPLATRKAREALPNDYKRAEAVLSSSRANLLTAALIQKRWDLLSTAMQDHFHQPYREQLVPGLKRLLRQSVENGAIGVALSGAGPTVLAFTEEKDRLTAYWREIFAEENIPVRIETLRPCPHGADVQLTVPTNHSTFVGNH